MQIPFTIEQFLNVFAEYNVSVWPMQIILYVFALLSIFLVFQRIKNSDKIISCLLAFFWLWMGVVYHMIYFTAINKAAYIFAVLYIIQTGLFLYSGILKDALAFRYQHTIYGIIGTLLILYALIIYPLLGYGFGHIYPRMPLFGLPCPTTIFTFSLLLWNAKKIPLYLLIIPLLWSLIGFSAAINLQIYEDFGLVLAGVSGTVLVMIKNKTAEA